MKAFVSASIRHAEIPRRVKLNLWQLHQKDENMSFQSLNVELDCVSFKVYVSLIFLFLSRHPRGPSAKMSGMDVLSIDHNETGIPPVDNGTFLRFSPTSASTSAAASSPGRPGNVYVYVWLFLGLLVFLLTLLIISLHRLKNIISSSSSLPDLSSEGGSSFTNMEICSISSQRSTISSLST